MQQEENSIPAVVISVKAPHVDDVILLTNLPAEVALGKPEFGGTDPNIPVDNNCTDDELHFGIPGCNRDYQDNGDKSNNHNAILSAS